MVESGLTTISTSVNRDNIGRYPKGVSGNPLGPRGHSWAIRAGRKAQRLLLRVIGPERQTELLESMFKAAVNGDMDMAKDLADRCGLRFSIPKDDASAPTVAVQVNNLTPDVAAIAGCGADALLAKTEEIRARRRTADPSTPDAPTPDP